MLSIRPFALLYIFLIHSFECSRCDALSIAARGCGMRSSSAPSTDHRSIWTRSRPNLDVNIETRTAMVQSLAANLPISRVGSRTSTALQMVLSTPENIIEQASTQKLLDTLLDESVRTQSRHPIMLQFNPSRKWIWRQWRGTVFSETWKSCLTNMALATSVVFLYRIYPSLKENLQGFSILWGQLLSVTTFTLTFFLNQSYGLWRKCYDYSRRLQGRLNDLGMTLAAHATRTKPSSPDVPSTYTPQSRQALELVSRYVRVFNLLTYASFTRSHRPILTPRGMRRLVERGILTSREREILSDAEVPATQRHNAVLLWLMRLFVEGRQAGVFEGGMGFEEQFLEKCHVIRAQYGAIGDELQGRMPLAYAHIVQVLLDVVLWMYPFMALSTGMAWYIGILGTGLLTVFYQGLFDLAKQFLDPYDNENYGKGDDPLVIDTLIAETNAGSVRWLNSFQQQPWNRQSLVDGELSNLILPLRGYSTEYLAEKQAQEEKEKQERELAIREKKRKEDERDRQRAEALLLEHVALMENGTSAVLGERRNGSAVLTPEGEVLIDNDIVGKVSSNMIFMEVYGGEVVTTTPLLSRGVSVPKIESRTVMAATNVTSLTSSSTSSISVDGRVAIDNPLFLDDTNEGTAPNLEESITKMNDYKPSAPLQLFNVEFDENIIEDDDFFAPLQVEWFDEVGPDGKEYRLSQMLADEDWSVDDDGGVKDKAIGLLENDLQRVITSKPMTYDEFAQKATEIIEQVNQEIAETKEIMSVPPGRDAEYDVKNRERIQSPVISTARRTVVDDDSEPLYDQTKLDGISQLWGAPPEVLDRKISEEDDESELGILNDGIDFRHIYSLWGSAVKSGIKSLGEEEMNSLTPTFDGFSQLWNEDVSPYGEDESDGIENDFIDQADQREGVDFQAYSRLEWWDEVSEDGKELRLSQILADEIYEEAIDEGVDTPMTFERFVEETEMLIEQAEFERKETEAIMKAPPNAAFLDTLEDPPTVSSVIDEAVVSSAKFEEIILSLSEQNEAYDCIDKELEVDDNLRGDNPISNIISPISDAYQQIADVGRTILKDDSD